MLPPSLTNDYRRYMLTAVRGACFDVLLTIQNGKLGPRGGTSKMSIETYMVQEVITDPLQPSFPDRVFMLAKLSGDATCIDDIVDDAPECVYEVRIPPVGGPIGSCTCDGGVKVGNCKHLDTCMHLCYVVGIGKNWKPRSPLVLILDCSCYGTEPGCSLCDGTGFVEVEPLRSEEREDVAVEL